MQLEVQYQEITKTSILENQFKPAKMNNLCISTGQNARASIFFLGFFPLHISSNNI